MKGFHLSKQELIELRIAHKAAKKQSASAAYRINAVMLLGTAWTLKRVKSALLLDDETLRGYVANYKESGIDGLLATNYKGRECKLTENDQNIVRQELDSHIYLTTHAVIEFIEKNFGIKYTPSGARDLLHRLGYEYKKPKLVPGNPDNTRSG